METVLKIYQAIQKNSDFIIHRADEWTRELAGSKNFVCTPDMLHWTFGKSVGYDGAYHYSGGQAKQRLYSLGFRNVLENSDSELVAPIVDAFLLWTDKVAGYPIREKFERDQSSQKRFELLVHQDVLKLKSSKQTKKGKSDNQKSFDEGFKKDIVRELLQRNSKVIRLAKDEHGTICSVCEFDFSKTFGSHGAGFIEMHHLYPIAQGERKTTVDDLRPVCPNCHRMLHKGKKLLSLEELKEIIKIQKNKLEA